MSDDATPTADAESAPAPSPVDEFLADVELARMTQEQLRSRHAETVEFRKNLEAAGMTPELLPDRERLLDHQNEIVALVRALVEGDAAPAEGLPEAPAPVEPTEPAPQPEPASDGGDGVHRFDPPADADLPGVHAELVTASIGDAQAEAGAGDSATAADIFAAATTVAPVTDHDGAGLFAAVGGAVSEGNAFTTGDALTLGSIAEKAFNAAQRSNGEFRWRRDRLAGFDGLARLGENIEANRRAQSQAHELGEALTAALCGPPEPDRMVPVCSDDSRPIAGLFGPPLPINRGIVGFYQGFGVCDITDGSGIWTCEDSAKVDPADPATWKQCATLPDCETQCTARMHFLYQCLLADVCDDISRPEFIEAMTRVLSAKLAREAEQRLLNTIDAYSYNMPVPNDTGYGAVPHIYDAVGRLLSADGKACRRGTTEYAAIIDQCLAAGLMNDMWNAGVTGMVMDQLREILSALDVTRIVVTQDWGDFEGPGTAPLPAPQPKPDGPGAGDGVTIDLPPWSSTASVRLVPVDDYRWGATGVEEFGLTASANLKLQNKKLWFGETAEIMYKVGCNYSYRLDFTELCFSGARADRVAPYCP